jgi:glyoxylase-like metal-dependent hydrolase (beta-lactamase superfamily II)
MEIIALKLSVTTCYLVKAPSKYILIDMGYLEDWELFCERLSAVKVSLSEISHIILTHHHDDHCGLLNKIIRENPDIQVVMSYLAKELLLTGENDRTQGGGIINWRVKQLLSLKQAYLSVFLKKVIDKKKNLTFPPYHVRPNDILVKGETQLRSIGINLDGRIVATPGHTIDGISVFFDDGDCVVGDAAANFLQFAGTKYCVIFVSDLDEYYQSWRIILSEHARMIFPGHGKPFPVEELNKNMGKNKKENMVLL